MANVDSYPDPRVHPMYAPERVQWNSSADKSAHLYYKDDVAVDYKEEKPNLKMKEELCLCTRNLWN